MDPPPIAVVLPTHCWGTDTGGQRALAVHGLSSTANTWWQVADQLARDVTSLVAPDLRGHGRAPRDQLPDRRPRGRPCRPRERLGSRHRPLARRADRCHRRPCAGLRVRPAVLDPVFEIADDQLDAVVAEQLSGLDPHADPAVILAANPSWHPRMRPRRRSAPGSPAPRSSNTASATARPGIISTSSPRNRHVHTSSEPTPPSAPRSRPQPPIPTRAHGHVRADPRCRTRHPPRRT